MSNNIFLCGDLDLNPKCMMREKGDPVEMTRVVSEILKLLFFRLGHDVNVNVVHGENPTRAFSENGDHNEVRQIKRFANLVFSVYFHKNYDAEKTISFLEKRGIIPPVEGFTR
jgi:hypothetical protein